MFAFAIDTFKHMRIWFFFLGFKSRRVNYTISLIAPCYIPIMFDFVRAIILLVFNAIYIVSKSGITSLPTVLALQNTQVYVSFSDSCNMSSYIEISVNKILNLYTILKILNIYL